MKCENYYSSPIGLTSQFRFCPNAFRVDTYKGCTFGCTYCFANITNAQGHQGFGSADVSEISRAFHNAFCTKAKDNLTLELLRHRVPLHCGGKSDPFQKREFKEGRTYDLLRLSNRYNYPICFSTKTADLPDVYFDLLRPDIHAFQVSILGWTDEFISKWEYNTPTAKERLAFVKKLRDRGFWCSIRIQPMIDIEEVELLLTNAKDIPSYITVEHLKLPSDNNAELSKLAKNVDIENYSASPYTMRNLELRRNLKVQNIERVKKIAHKYGVKVGVGDNDLHHLSDTRNCCGIDTIGGAFSNYLKYNLTYFVTGEQEDIDLMFTPNSSIDGCFYSGDTNIGKSYKQVVNDYIRKFPALIPERSKWLLKKLRMPKLNRLF